MKMLSESSIKIESGKRTLLVPSKNFPVEILYLRDDDIPQAVASGIADVGVVGENEFAEKAEDATVVKRLDFSRCRLSLAIPKSVNYQGVEWFEGKKIATSYPKILADFLKTKKINAEIHVITGSVEIAPGIGLADCIFDIVSSGGTLVSNNLKEVEIVMHSEAVMIANNNLTTYKKTILDELMFRFDSYKEAEGKKYIILNIPNDKIETVCQILPGMKSPTVTPLVEKGWSSLHSVIDEKKFWDIIGQLKTLGAEGILVIPIEKMIL
jgi:ATP phosphoribosyltransferase